MKAQKMSADCAHSLVLNKILLFDWKEQQDLSVAQIKQMIQMSNTKWKTLMDKIRESVEKGQMRIEKNMVCTVGTSEGRSSSNEINSSNAIGDGVVTIKEEGK